MLLSVTLNFRDAKDGKIKVVMEMKHTAKCDIQLYTEERKAYAFWHLIGDSSMIIIIQMKHNKTRYIGIICCPFVFVLFFILHRPIHYSQNNCDLLLIPIHIYNITMIIINNSNNNNIMFQFHRFHLLPNNQHSMASQYVNCTSCTKSENYCRVDLSQRK